MNRTPHRWLKQIRRRWMIVVAVTLVVLVGAVIQALTATPSYVGKSTLAVTGRGPQEDTVTAVGYLTIFNDPVTVERLVAERNFPAGVTYDAETAAASPILIIQATADDPELAQNAASNMADAFRDDVNDVQGAGRARYIADLEKQLKTVRPVLGDNSPNLYYNSLRDRIDNLRADQTNLLIALQPRAGVETQAPNTVVTILSGLVGGALLGILAAMAAAVMSRRVRRAEDIEEETAVDVLAATKATGLTDDRQLRSFVNSLGGKPHVELRSIVLTDCGSSRDARVVADALAELLAMQGRRTIVVHADTSSVEKGQGFTELLGGDAEIDDVLESADIDNLSVIGTGAAVDDRFSLITRDRMTTLYSDLRSRADLAIVSAPALSDGAETEPLCATADGTVLVVRKGSTLKREVVSTDDALRTAGANVLGAIIVGDG
ncbi:hypothetical protein [Mycolicibacterium gilvum]|uniref:hypothetical protein n=1 Tax=Mycolicibacterium gilvum TaxID=1804 RepID=UPI00404592A4